MIKKALIITLFLNSIILIAVPAGHGAGLMIMIEYISVQSLIETGVSFRNEYPFESSLILIGLVSLIGKLVVIATLFSRDIITRRVWLYIGLTLMLMAFLAICYGAWQQDNFLFAIAFGSGIPFLMYYGYVLHQIYKERKLQIEKT